jgi:hypothetical protein
VGDLLMAVPQYDPEVVRELMSDDNPVLTETRWGEGWTLDDFAELYAAEGWDVTGRGEQ